MAEIKVGQIEGLDRRQLAFIFRLRVRDCSLGELFMGVDLCLDVPPC